jgi:tetratricopeptide (TPR) repeat protein
MRLTTFAFLAAVAAATPALAQPSDSPTLPGAPTPEDLANAKKAFEEGNALFKAGKLDEAVVKLKESYRLSRNAYLLYNIGHTYDQLGQKELVLFYYRKFLSSAPANAPMRDGVQKRVTALEAENVAAVTPEGETTENDAAKQPVGPVSKWGPKDFKHEMIFTAPPGWPIDVTAAVPAEANFTVKLFYRSSGDAAFLMKPMTWRNYELVARIPGTKATGKWVQYYIEVRDSADKLVTRSGKSTSPNLVNIEPNTKKQYYADYIDEGGEVVAPAPVEGITYNDGTQGPVDAKPSTVVKAVKWTTTGLAVGFFATSFFSYRFAVDQHDKLVADSNECGRPPCRPWDEAFGEKVQSLGKRYDTIYKVTLGLGIASAGVATFLWVRDLTRKKSSASDASSTAWMIAPTVTPELAGATAAVEF